MGLSDLPYASSLASERGWSLRHDGLVVQVYYNGEYQTALDSDAEAYDWIAGNPLDSTANQE